MGYNRVKVKPNLIYVKSGKHVHEANECILRPGQDVPPGPNLVRIKWASSGTYEWVSRNRVFQSDEISVHPDRDRRLRQPHSSAAAMGNTTTNTTNTTNNNNNNKRKQQTETRSTRAAARARVETESSTVGGVKDSRKNLTTTQRTAVNEVDMTEELGDERLPRTLDIPQTDRKKKIVNHQHPDSQRQSNNNHDSEDESAITAPTCFQNDRDREIQAKRLRKAKQQEHQLQLARTQEEKKRHELQQERQRLIERQQRELQQQQREFHEDTLRRGRNNDGPLNFLGHETPLPSQMTISPGSSLSRFATPSQTPADQPHRRKPVPVYPPYVDQSAELAALRAENFQLKQEKEAAEKGSEELEQKYEELEQKHEELKQKHEKLEEKLMFIRHLTERS